MKLKQSFFLILSSFLGLLPVHAVHITDLSSDKYQKSSELRAILDKFADPNKIVEIAKEQIETEGWMLKRIDHDLSLFSPDEFEMEKLKAHYKNYFLNPSRQMLFIQYKEKKLKVTYGSDKEIYFKFSRESAVVNAIKYLVDHFSLPDFALLVTTHDSYDYDPYLAPVCCFAKNKNSLSILLPDPEGLSNYTLSAENNISLNFHVAKGDQHSTWEKKKDILFFRGATTGGFYSKSNWQTYPRSQLCLLSLQYPYLIDAKITKVAQSEAGVEKLMKERGIFGKPVAIKDSIRYKYLIDLDGNTASYPRNYWVLLSSSVLFKQESDAMLWYYDLLKPWENYIPVKRDFSDLVEKIDWAKNHDREARSIAEEGARVAKKEININATLAYLYILLESLAMIQNF